MSEKLYATVHKLHELLRANTLASGRRTLEASRRHTVEQVQELRNNLAAAKKELEEQRPIQSGQQHKWKRSKEDPANSFGEGA